MNIIKFEFKRIISRPRALIFASVVLFITYMYCINNKALGFVSCGEECSKYIAQYFTENEKDIIDLNTINSRIEPYWGNQEEVSLSLVNYNEYLQNYYCDKETPQNNSFFVDSLICEYHEAMMWTGIMISVVVPLLVLIVQGDEDIEIIDYFSSMQNKRNRYKDKYRFSVAFAILFSSIIAFIVALIFGIRYFPFLSEDIYGIFSPMLCKNTMQMPFALYLLLCTILIILFSLVVSNTLFAICDIFKKGIIKIVFSVAVSVGGVLLSKAIWLDNIIIKSTLSGVNLSVLNEGLGTVNFKLFYPIFAIFIIVVEKLICLKSKN